MELHKLHISQKDLEHLFQSAEIKDNFVFLPAFLNPWLFLYIFKNFKIYFSELLFRGNLNERMWKKAMVFVSQLDDCFDENFETAILKKNLISLFEKNETQKIELHQSLK